MSTYERTPYVDELVIDGESIVLLEHRAIRLYYVGTSILSYLDRPRTGAELAAQLEDEYGAPEDRDLLEATESAVYELMVHDLVRLSSAE